jgi:hypothetical protein
VRNDVQNIDLMELAGYCRNCLSKPGSGGGARRNIKQGIATTVTRSVWELDDNLIEMTYCAITGGVLRKKVTKPSPYAPGRK